MKIRKNLVLAVAAAASLGAAVSAYAYNTLSISSEPLGTSTGVSIKPNLWFILDDSGSMDQTYTPDWVNGNSPSLCQRNMASAGSTYSCDVGDPPYMAAGFNKSFYNPAITYTPPYNADGTSKGNASATAAKGEPFKYPSASTALTTCFDNTVNGGNGTCNLTTKFPDKWYCDSTGTLDTTHCKKNGTATPYTYPNGTYLYNRQWSANSAGAPYYYVMTGSPAWCSTSSLTYCPSKKYKASTPYPNFAAYTGATGVQAKMTLQIDTVAAGGKVTKLVAGSTTIFNGTVNSLGADSCTNRNALAVSLASSVGGGYSGAVTTSCGTGCAAACKPVITITAPGSSTATTNTSYNGIALTVTASSVSTTKSGNFGNGVDYSASNSAVTFTRVDILPATTSYTKYASRTDCAGATCTYAEELQNFANWYSYYRGRLLMMKSAAATAFKDVSDTAPGVGFRVGFSVISVGTSNVQSGFTELKIADFDSTQKSSFYTKLFSIVPNSYTPLRTALARAGQIYAGTIYTGTNDPVKYSCQQNYTFMATDGYWNTNIEPNTKFNMTASAAVGDQDGGDAVPYKDALAKADTLADIARYYYKTDLRSTWTNDVPKASGDETLAGNSQMHQHMKTFTMGLGVDGNITYSAAYRSGGSSDYQSILAGTMNWGDPITNTTSDRIDDLWHAAVNGHGVYFSASDPTDVAVGISQTLGAAQQETGSSAAAATSNLEPVAGDNYAYVASYTTSVWDGNLEAKYIDITTGSISDAASANIWSARDQLDTKAAAGSRTLVTGNAGGGQRTLSWGNLTATEQGYFNPTQIASCSPIALCPGATNQNLFSFVTGGGDTTTTGSYRARSHVLGDIVSSQPIYVKASKFSYYDSGYDSFRNSTESRTGMVYVGANDGFLHAFNATSGQEAWAYAPTSVLPNLYKLADPSYQHIYYVDGTLTVGDALVSGSWKTILVGGMNAGGRSYFALDVTSPGTPTVLWEFTDTNMGYTYGNPVITKLKDGTWVALLTSGYNNGSTVSGDGKGYLYVVDLATGSLKFKLSTGSGSASAPSGLGKIANWVDDPIGNNTTRWVYGGDLNGTIWRFDLDNQAVLAGGLMNIGRPITVKPELAEVNYKRTVFVGTGLFLEAAQRDPANNVGNAIYGIRDDDVSATLSSSSLVSLSSSDFTSSNGITESQWNDNKGWMLTLGSGYFVNVDPKIQLSTLAVAANHVATAAGDATTSCTAAKGDHVIYFIDFATGGAVKDSSHPAVVTGTSLAVGINIIRLADGKLKIIVTTSDNKHLTDDVAVSSGTSKARRISWRELTTN